jgi:hypothetical protein
MDNLLKKDQNQIMGASDDDFALFIPLNIDADKVFETNNILLKILQNYKDFMEN